MLTKEQLDIMSEELDPTEPPHNDSWYYANQDPTAHMWREIGLTLLEEVKRLMTHT